MVRDHGHAVSNGESCIGMRNMSTPHFKHAGVRRYALCVTGVFVRMMDGLFVQAQQLALEASHAISYELSYRRHP